MARRRMTVLDIMAIITAWDTGEGNSAIARRLGYTRATVRKYTDAAVALGLPRGASRRSEAEWVRAAHAVIDRVARQRAPGTVTAAVARHHAYLEEWVGQVHLSGKCQNSVQSRKKSSESDEKWGSSRFVVPS